EQESLLAERHEPGNNLAETKVESAWSGKVTGCGSVNATISICTEFLAGTVSKKNVYPAMRLQICCKLAEHARTNKKPDNCVRLTAFYFCPSMLGYRNREKGYLVDPDPGDSLNIRIRSTG